MYPRSNSQSLRDRTLTSTPTNSSLGCSLAMLYVQLEDLFDFDRHIALPCQPPALLRVRGCRILLASTVVKSLPCPFLSTPRQDC